MSNSNEKIEKDLFLIFKKHGYLFPTTEEEVERFERLYGTTDIEMPDKFKTPEAVYSKIESEKIADEEEIGKSYAMAARGGKKLPKDVLSKMRSDRAGSIAKSKSTGKKK